MKDRSAETLLLKALARGTNERFGRLAALLGELEARAALALTTRDAKFASEYREGVTARDAKFASEYLPRVSVMAALDVEKLVPTGTRSPDPTLRSLIPT
jgi:hypothetical protein